MELSIGGASLFFQDAIFAAGSDPGPECSDSLFAAPLPESGCKDINPASPTGPPMEPSHWRCRSNLVDPSQFSFALRALTSPLRRTFHPNTIHSACHRQLLLTKNRLPAVRPGSAIANVSNPA